MTEDSSTAQSLASLSDDYYGYLKEREILVGQRTGTVIRVGQAVRARLASVSLDRLEIDLELVSLAPSRSGDVFVQGRAEAPRSARKPQRQATRKDRPRGGSSRPGGRSKPSSEKGGGKGKRRGR